MPNMQATATCLVLDFWVPHLQGISHLHLLHLFLHLSRGEPASCLPASTLAFTAHPRCLPAGLSSRDA